MSTGPGDPNVPDPIGEASVRVAQLLAMTATLIEAVALLRARCGDRPKQPARPTRTQQPAVSNLAVRPSAPALVARPPLPSLLAARAIRHPLPALPPAPVRRQLTNRPSSPGGTP